MALDWWWREPAKVHRIGGNDSLVTGLVRRLLLCGLVYLSLGRLGEAQGRQPGPLTLAVGAGLGGGFVKTINYSGNLQRLLQIEAGRRITSRLSLGVEYLAARNIVPQGCDLVGPCAPPVEFRAGIASASWTPRDFPLLAAGLGLYRLEKGNSGEKETLLGLHGGLDLPLLHVGTASAFSVRIRGTLIPGASAAPIGTVALLLGFRYWIG